MAVAEARPLLGGLRRVVAVLPAGPASWPEVAEGEACLARLGVDVHIPDTLRDAAPGAPPWLAGPDLWRAGAVAAAITDPTAGALWTIRGGFGSARLLGAGAQLLVEAQARRGREGLGPMPLVSFSDGTALLAFWVARGWPAFSGPPLTQLRRLSELSEARLRAGLHAGHLAPFSELRPLARGAADGPLFVANLCVLASIVGTPAAPDLAGTVLVLEDTGEPPYKIDRMLTQLALAGALDRIAGLVFADFVADRRLPSATLDDLARVLGDFATSWCAPRGVPVASGLPVGHGRDNAFLPCGRAAGFIARLEVGAEDGRLSFAPATGST